MAGWYHLGGVNFLVFFLGRVRWSVVKKCLIACREERSLKLVYYTLGVA
jgi:hypothetical protein